VRRFGELLREALSDAPERIAVKVPKAVNAKRIEGKRRRGRLKRDRVVDLSDEY